MIRRKQRRFRRQMHHSQIRRHLKNPFESHVSNPDNMNIQQKDTGHEVECYEQDVDGNWIGWHAECGTGGGVTQDCQQLVDSCTGVSTLVYH